MDNMHYYEISAGKDHDAYKCIAENANQAVGSYVKNTDLAKIKHDKGSGEPLEITLTIKRLGTQVNLAEGLVAKLKDSK